jgi:serine/threonine-protein phosphatase 2A activator
LNNIAGVIHWEKINGGMFKMYEVEVLGKVPIIQHFMFGSIFAFPEK